MFKTFKPFKSFKAFCGLCALCASAVMTPAIPALAQRDALKVRENLEAVIIRAGDSKNLTGQIAPKGTQVKESLQVRGVRSPDRKAPDTLAPDPLPVRGGSLRAHGTVMLAQIRDGQVIDVRGPFRNLIVNAGETALRDCFIATSCTPVQAWKFHGIGTGATAAAEGDTGCQTELTTQYNPDNTRATGSQTNNGANVYRTVGTNTVDAAAAVTEWCLLTAATGAGTPMWSRVVFSTINLASGDSLQTTYDLTIE